MTQFWRGNMANIYRTWIQLSLKVFFYDKIKNYFMPYDTRKYKGFDFMWRATMAGTVGSALTLLLSYPFDLVHTRMTTDLTKKGQKRLFTTSFDCFNRTHLDEGRRGLYKGFELALLNAALRGAVTLPIYEMIKNTSFMKQANTTSDSSSLLNTFMQRLGPSMISSLALSMVLYPLDTLKRSMQLNGGRG